MSSQSKWNTEKTKILSLSLEEKRKLYKAQDFVTITDVEPWVRYVMRNKEIRSKIPNQDDLAEFKKIKYLNADKNQALTEKVSIFKGDITKLEIDAIVNAANSQLRAGGGVDGAIHRAAGPLLQMSSQSKWNTEKTKILSLSLEEKRKLYKAQDFVTITDVEPWVRYVMRNKEIRSKIPNQDDLAEFKKIKYLNADKNQALTEKVSIFKGDITKLEIDAIVNAANSQLRAGGGVDGAIHRAAGPLLQEENNTLLGCPTGEAKIAGGYNLPAKYVIHTVGPQDGSAAKLEACYKNCFAIQAENKIKTIAFPCISTGIYGFPNRLAAHIALRAARKALETNEDLERVIFCTFMPIDVDIYETLMQMYFPVQ